MSWVKITDPATGWSNLLGGGSGVSATLTAGDAGATSVPLTLSLSAGATLVSWSVQRRKDGGAWSTIATGLTGLGYTATGLDSLSDYDFQADVVVQEAATSNVVAVTTAELTQDYDVIMLDAYTDTTYTNGGEQSYAMRIVNNGAGPIYGVQVHGRNTISGHAQIKGAVLGSGNVNASTFAADDYVQAPFGGVNTFTPPDGSQESSPYWLTDDIDFPAPIQEGESGIVRLAVAAGAVCYPGMGTGTARLNSGDLLTGWATSAGDYGSTPANAANNPSWNGGISVLPFGLVLKRDASSVGPRHGAFGDSIINGAGNGSVRDRWVWKANSLLTGNRKITPFGRAGLTVQDYCTLFEYWLANSPIAALFASCSISGWSWNNLGDQTSQINAAVDSAVAAGNAANKRMSVWFPTPAGLQSGGYGNIASRAACYAHCVSQGYNVVDTSGPITDVDGISILATKTGDGVHLNESGQDDMGAGVAAAQSVIFG